VRREPSATAAAVGFLIVPGPVVASLAALTAGYRQAHLRVRDLERERCSEPTCSRRSRPAEEQHVLVRIFDFEAMQPIMSIFERL